MEPIVWDMFVDETKEKVSATWKEVESTNTKRGLILWFHAEWCKPCCRLEPEVKSLMESEEGQRWKWMDIRVPQDAIEKEELK